MAKALIGYMSSDLRNTARVTMEKIVAVANRTEPKLTELVSGVVERL